MRRYIVLLLSFVLFGFALWANARLHELSYDILRGYTNPTRDANVPFFVLRGGVQIVLLNTPPDEQRAQLEMLHQTRFTWLREEIPLLSFVKWPSLWDAADALAALLSQDTQLRWFVAFSLPSHAAEKSEWLQTLTRFVERYGHVIDAYEILPDAGMTLEGYTTQLRTAHALIHQLDAQATVIAHIADPRPHVVEQLYGLGIKEMSDALAVAVRIDPNISPLDREISDNKRNVGQLVALREVMQAHDDSQKTLWLTKWQPITPFADATAEAQYLEVFFARLAREWTWVGAVTLHTLADATTTFASAYQHLTPEYPSNGLFHPKSSSVRYSGLWTWSQKLGADIGWLETSDSQLTFDFYGREVALLLNEDDYFAFLYPRIEGQRVNRLPTDSAGNPYVLLRSASTRPERTLRLIADDLTHQTHRLHLIADKGWDRWAIQGFAVSDGDLAAPYRAAQNASLVAVLLTALACLSAVLSFSPRRQIARALSYIAGLRFVQQLSLALVTSLGSMVALLEHVSQNASLLRREPVQYGLGLLLSGGMVFFDLPLLVALLFGGCLFLLILIRLELGISLVLLWLPFFLFPVELYRFAFPMAELVLLLTSGVWLIRLLAGRLAWRTKLSPLDGLVLLWLLIGTFALTWSADQRVASTDWRVMFVEPALFYAILRTGVSDTAMQRRLTYMLIAAAVLMSVIGLGQFCLGQAVITAEGGTYRLAGVYGSPNNVALFITRVLPFVLFYAWKGRGAWRWVSLACAFVLTITLLLTQSVGGILIGAPVGVAILLMLCDYRRARTLLLLGLLVTAAALFVLPNVSPRFAKLIDLSEGTNFIRVRMWESAWQMVQDAPLTGVGLDQFLYAFRADYVKPDAIWDADLSHPHNIVFDFWLRLGVLGLFLLLLLSIFLVKELRHALREKQHKDAIPIAAVCGALLAYGMIDNSVFVNDLVLIMMLLLGFTANLARKY